MNLYLKKADISQILTATAQQVQQQFMSAIFNIIIIIIIIII